jgi:hypothetical protein
MLKVVVFVLIIVTGMVCLYCQTPDEVKALIDQTRQELADSLVSAQQYKSSIPTSYPVPRPKSEFETTEEYQQRLISDYYLPIMNEWPRFSIIDSTTVSELKSRLTRLRSSTCTSRAITVTPIQYNADSGLWRMTVQHLQYKQERYTIDLRISRNHAMSLNEIWDRVIIRGQLGFDYNDDVVLIRLILVNPDTNEIFTHNIEPIKLMYSTEIVSQERWFGLSPEAKYLVSMGRYNLQECWEVRDPQSLELLGSESDYNSLNPPVFSPDNKLMASPGSNNESIIIHTLPNARTVFTIRGGRMGAMVFSPDSRFFIYYRYEYGWPNDKKQLIIMDLYKNYSATLYNATADITSLAITPDNKFLIIGTNEPHTWLQALKMDLSTLEIVDRCELPNNADGVTGIHFNSDSSLVGLTYNAWDDYALIVKLDDFENISTIPVGLFHEFEFSPDGAYALTRNHGIEIYDIVSTNKVYESQNSPSFNVTRFYPDQRYVFLGPWIGRTYLDLPIPSLNELIETE